MSDVEESVVDSLESHYERDLELAEEFEAAAAKPMKSMTPCEIARFLKEKGIPDKYCTVFEGKTALLSCVCFNIPSQFLYTENYIDGIEFTTLVEKDVVGMISPKGIVRKIMRLLPQAQGSIEVKKKKKKKKK